MSSRGDREPVQGENKQGRTLFFVILGLIVFLFVVFLAFKPRGSQAGPPAQTTHSQ
jgi:Na+/melibiose symporter-like transporter